MSAVLQFPPAGHRREPACTLEDFSRGWFEGMAVGWRDTTRDAVRTILRAHLLPALGKREVTEVSRADVLAFRTRLAAQRSPSGHMLSPRRINRVIDVLGQVLSERELQLGILNPCRQLRRIPHRRAIIRPFSLPELQRVVDVAPEHLRDYLWIRGLTGLRSGEANGLCWDQVDWDNLTLTIRAARVRGRQVLPKNEFSERVIALTPTLQDALFRQWTRTGSESGFVFLSVRGCPLDSSNFGRRDWPRLLDAARLSHRSPETLRHTAATLMLAAGEAPTFVARTLGHSDCRMLFSTYARFVANTLGPVDGQRLEAAILQPHG